MRTAKDATALGALFTENAEIVDDEGEVTRGRPAIVERFAGLFAANEGGTLEVNVDSTHLLSPESGIEEGTATVSGDEGENPETSRYSVIYVKRDGRWSARAHPGSIPSEPSAHDRLEDLEWMIGEWLNESDDALVSTTCRGPTTATSWSVNSTSRSRANVALRGTQRIGWDPLRKQFRTWVFDTEGGFAEGLMCPPDGDQWIVKSNGVRSDGQPVTATSIFTPLGPDRVAWQAAERTVGGVALPDFDQYVMVRKPPEPAT